MKIAQDPTRFHHAAVRGWKRIIQISVDLGCSVIGTEPVTPSTWATR